MENENKQEFEEVESEVPIIYQEDIVAVAEMAERRIAAADKIKKIALKVTNSNDWVDENGRPYLQSSGGEKVARVFGISISKLRFEKTNLVEGHYMYTFFMTFSMKGSSIEVIGTRTSNDDLYSKRKKYVDDNGKKLDKPISYSLPASEVDEANIKKAAYTNCTANGISRFLGLRNFTWEELAEYGIYPGKNRVTYGKKGKEKTGEDPANGDTKQKAHKMMVEMYGNSYGDELEKISGFPGTDKKTGEKITIPGKKSLGQLSEKWLKTTYGSIKKKHEEWKKAKGSQEPPEEKEQSEMTEKDIGFVAINEQLDRVGSRAFIEATKAFKGKSYPADYSDDDRGKLLDALYKLPDK